MTWKYLACLSGHGASPEPPPNLAAALHREGCSKRAAGEGISLFAGADLQVRPFESRRALVIGQLFDRSGTSAPHELAAGFERSDADTFVETYWGSYVVLARGAGPGGLVLRDPSGGLPCYHANFGGLHVFTSVPHLLVDCGLVAADIDWDVIAASLARHSLRTRRTALLSIDEVLPGRLQEFAAGRSRRAQVWDPYDHAMREPPVDAAAALGDALGTTFRALGQCAARPLVEVSGGLDSAIVAAGIAEMVPATSMITFAAATGDPDETAYARALAEHLGVPLEIAVPRIEDVDLERSLSRNLPRPNARAFAQAADARSLAHARAIGADGFFSGGGGDDVLCYLRSALPALDRLRAEGPAAMFATASDIATMSHATVWEALWGVVRRAIRRAPSPPRTDMRFLSRELAASEHSEAARAADPRLLPGKVRHLEGILTIHNYLEGHARAEFAPIYSPLLSQPVVECCLAIPTWQWCAGGRNRAVARQAFAGRLPRLLVERRSKGSFDGFCAALLEANRELVREMLLGGRLASEDLLDRQAIEDALDAPYPPAEHVARLLALVDVECWLSSRAGSPRSDTKLA